MAAGSAIRLRACDAVIAGERNGSPSTSPDVRIASVQADAGGNVSGTITAAAGRAAAEGRRPARTGNGTLPDLPGRCKLST